MAVNRISVPPRTRVHADHLELRAGNGAVRRLHHVWLRDNCPCEECTHPGSGQRIVDTAGIPAQIRPKLVSVGSDSLVLAWSDDHRSVYGLDMLWELPQPGPSRAQVWRAADPLPEPVDGALALHDDGALERALAMVEVFGFARLSGCRHAPGCWRTSSRGSGTCARPTTAGSLTCAA